ncbi:MAG: uracil-DNA glycosylase family protein [Candidatus Thorarchaeota archaeon]
MRCSPVGPTNAKLMIIGEAPGSEEERAGKPFVGSSGQELTRMLTEAGLNRDQIYLTNVFLDRPPGNKFQDEWCRGKKEVSQQYKEILPSLQAACPEVTWPSTYTWNLIAQGKYLMPEYLPELFRLKGEIEQVSPNLIVPMGGTPTWAVLGVGGIGKLRGVITESSLVPGIKVLPTWHPAYIQRVWDQRLIAITDLMKAKQECEFPEIRRPERFVTINPTIKDMVDYEPRIRGAKVLAFDTETAHRQITCISFAPSAERAIVIPFVDKSKSGYNYWATPAEEVQAWRIVARWLDLPMPKLAQNGLYDLQYLWRVHGIPIRNFLEDTMLLHHSIYIELKKDLGFLGSVYTDEASWKLMRQRSSDVVEKKDD